MKHIPVLKNEVLRYLDLSNRGLIIDATLGLGGHSEAILESKEFKGKILGIDQDQSHLDFAKEGLKKYGDRFTAVKANFSELEQLINTREIKFDGILFDLGIASPHLDLPERGFSYQSDGPLDMRMDRAKEMTAAEIINNFSADALRKIFRDYGEEPLSGPIVNRIAEERRRNEIKTTGQLAAIIEQVYAGHFRKRSIKHPATKVFQALRIAVNDEMRVLEKALDAAIAHIEENGRIIVISYHSLEDRIVKTKFREAANPCACPPKLPYCACSKKPQLRILNRKPIIPGDSEIILNPRSRSAKMRVGSRITRSTPCNPCTPCNP